MIYAYQLLARIYHSDGLCGVDEDGLMWMNPRWDAITNYERLYE